MSARTRLHKSASSNSDIPYEGMISWSFGNQALAVSSREKHFCKTLIAMKAAVDAPGEAPRRATSDWSAAPISSVPNSSNPPRSASGLMIWTRCPATCSFQSSVFAPG